MSSYSMGPHTLQVSSELFALNRKRLCKRLRDVGGVKNNAVVVLQGGVLQNLYDTDVDYVFRQVSAFYYHRREPDYVGYAAYYRDSRNLIS